MAENLRQKIKDKIGTGYYSITSDGWQQPTKSPSLQSVTVHSVDENFVRSDFVLNVAPLYEAHTGENLAEHIEKCLIKNGFPMEKLVMMVRDDAKNMIKTCRILEIESQLPPGGTLPMQCFLNFDSKKKAILALELDRMHSEIRTVKRAKVEKISNDHQFNFLPLHWQMQSIAVFLIWHIIQRSKLQLFLTHDLLEGQKNVSVDDEHLDDQNAAFSGLVHHDNVDLSALDEGGSSDESVRYDIWVTPKSPGPGSIPSTLSGEINADLNSKIESQLAHYKAIVRPAIDSDVFCWLSGEMAQNLLIIKANMNKLFLGPSNDVDEEENDENNENEAK
ncbi:hypothetical protein niasHT_002483 [Heterodera trifolii]|uniref:Uncharacterized protein n=1 Tax=Heterodera trifolii TaxID=157864 RepID=A0ABD2LMD9_9BILA